MIRPAFFCPLVLCAAACGGEDLGPYTAPAPFAVPLSASGPDQLQSAIAAPGGGFYAVGFRADAVGDGARPVVLVKLTTTGLDTSFGGGDGWVETALDFRGGSDEIDVVLQNGKLVISATIADEANTADRDIGLVRHDLDGSADASFGLVRHDLGAGALDGVNTIATDAPRGLAVDSQGRLYLHAVARGTGDFGGVARIDTDFVVLRLTAAGALDGTFADGGKFVVDLRGNDGPQTPSNATPHGIAVLADGGVLANGYATTIGIGERAQPVVIRLDSAGDPVAGFGTGGVFHAQVLTAQTEIYNVAVHGSHFVTAGYGRESGEVNDWVSLRMDVNTAALDPAWGGAPGGKLQFDVSGTGVADNCRNAVALPGGKTLLVGSTGPGNMPAQDAAFAVLTATGQKDTEYGTGIQVQHFGSENIGNDQYWGGAVSGDHILLVGYRGGGAAATQTATTNDDSFAAIMPLR